MKQGDLIDAYCLECHKDVNAFYEKYRIVMDSIDIEKLEIAAFHVTTCVDDCNEIKLYGLHNLQWVLENDTQLRRFLKQNYISFDIDNKCVYVGENVYDMFDVVLDKLNKAKEQMPQDLEYVKSLVACAD